MAFEISFQLLQFSIHTLAQFRLCDEDGKINFTTRCIIYAKSAISNDARIWTLHSQPSVYIHSRLFFKWTFMQF